MKTDQPVGLFLSATVGTGFLGAALLLLVNRPESSPVMLACLPVLMSLLSFGLLYILYLKPNAAQMHSLLARAQAKSPAGSTAPENRADDFTALRELIDSSDTQLREIRERERSMIKNAVDVICLLDIHGAVIQVNPACESSWGYKQDELLGRDLTKILQAGDSPLTLQAVLGSERSIEKVYFENRLPKKNGEMVDLLWSAHWSASDAGLFCVAHDITERKAVERKLAEREARIRSILESLPVGVAVVDASGVVESMNKTAHLLTGFEDDLNFRINAEKLLDFGQEPFPARKLNSLIEASRKQSIDCYVSCKNGQRFPAELSVSSLELSEGQRFVVIFLDQTLKHELERTKREFVAMVSHDLRTPLTSLSAILAFLEAGHGGELNFEGQDMVVQGTQEAERLIQLVNDLLDLEKMKAGKFTLRLANTDFRQCIWSAVDVVKIFARSRGVEIAVTCPGTLFISCDGARIIQVLANLLDNAVKYSAEGSTVKLEAVDGENDLSVSVSNSGREISPGKLALIFEKFEQLDESDRGSRKGTGLGLYICKVILEQHGGKIWAASSSSMGTKFTFSLPKVAVAD